MKNWICVIAILLFRCVSVEPNGASQRVLQAEYSVATETVEIDLTLWVEWMPFDPQDGQNRPGRVLLDGSSTGPDGTTCWQNVVAEKKAMELRAEFLDVQLAFDGLLGARVAVSGVGMGAYVNEWWSDELIVLVAKSGDRLDQRMAGAGDIRETDYGRIDAGFVVQNGRLCYQVERRLGNHRGVRPVARVTWPVTGRPERHHLSAASSDLAQELESLRRRWFLMPGYSAKVEGVDLVFLVDSGSRIDAIVAGFSSDDGDRVSTVRLTRLGQSSVLGWGGFAVSGPPDVRRGGQIHQVGSSGDWPEILSPDVWEPHPESLSEAGLSFQRIKGQSLPRFFVSAACDYNRDEDETWFLDFSGGPPGSQVGFPIQRCQEWAFPVVQKGWVWAQPSATMTRNGDGLVIDYELPPVESGDYLHHTWEYQLRYNASELTLRRVVVPSDGPIQLEREPAMLNLLLWCEIHCRELPECQPGGRFNGPPPASVSELLEQLASNRFEVNTCGTGASTPAQ